MAKISDLMEGKAPGSVKICHSTYSSFEWFRPYYKDSNDNWHGLLEDDRTLTTTIVDDWHLWSPPKKKKTLYQWAIKQDGHDNWSVSKFYYEGDGQLKEGYRYVGDNYRRLDYTAIEVDDE